MPARQAVLLRILIIVSVASLGFAMWGPEWSTSNIVALVGFSILLVMIAFLTLTVRTDQTVDGHRGLPRSFWVVFASFAGAFGLAMLVATLALPWIGPVGFTLLLREWVWWVFPLFAIGLFPIVNRHLR